MDESAAGQRRLTSLQQDRIECVVVGAGVVGLATARALAKQGREVVVLEATGVIGSEISSRNSGVIHAGIYYPAGSLKAELCVAGKHALYDFCETFAVEHRRVGKILVATDESQLPLLDEFRALAAGNDVKDLALLSSSDVTALEPEVVCVGALMSPSTGIIDVHDYLLALLGDGERHGVSVAFCSALSSATVSDRGITVEVSGEAGFRLQCDVLINAAGLSAQQVASSIRGMPKACVPPTYYAKGNYFYLTTPSPFKHLVYPMPTRGSLGVHVSFDTAGRCRFGPDIHWVESLEYNVVERRLDEFYTSVRRYWPGLPDDALAPDYTGIRPKLTREGEPAADFVIQTHEDHGIDGLVNLFGIESPGLTASLAIADRVASCV